MSLLRVQAIFLLLIQQCAGLSWHQGRPAFAGGFGANSKPKSATKKTRNSKKEKKGNGSFSGMKGLDPVDNAELKSSIASNGSSSRIQREKGKPQVDKWGLPIPTEDDLFQPLPPGTELVSAPSDPAKVTLSLIEKSLRNHTKLDLQRFDENGMERECLPGRAAMKLRLLHLSPPVLCIENFFTPEECQQVRDVAFFKTGDDQRGPMEVKSATFSAFATSKRTSTSWFCHYSQMPTLLAKAQHILGLPLPQMEEPQIVRYRKGEEFSWHYDEIPTSELKNGGQRVATILVYLNDVENGGGTIFRHLKDPSGIRLTVRPKLGSALLFFPAYDDGRPDDRTLHKGEVATDTKWISQIWIHEHSYTPVVPPDNSQEAALSAIQKVCDSLQYSTK